MKSIFNKKYAQETLPFFFFLVVSIGATFAYHKDSGCYNWKSEIWADKAGYYIYLPGLFLYQFDATKCPEGIDEKTGYGFRINHEDQKILTKYTYGISLLIMPFFVIAIFLSLLMNLPVDGGFGPVFHSIVNVSSVIYLVGGLFLSYRFLLKYFSRKISLSAVGLLFLGTNLFYYGICDTLMSHVYSFFLFSLFLLSLKSHTDNPEKWKWFVLLAFSSILIVLIRPSNIILWLLIFFLDFNGKTSIMNRILIIANWKRALLFIMVFALLFIPQFAYWKYSRGSWISWSYTNEGFTNWNSPLIKELWFSTLNGLFIYTPMFILMLIGILLMIMKKVSNGWLFMLFFFGISYLFSSWHCWYYGCSFGQRSFVEFYALFALPLGYTLQTIADNRYRIFRFLIFSLLTLICIINIRLSFSFEKCFFGSTWDWEEFSRELSRADLLKTENRFNNFRNDIENESINTGVIRTDSVYNSRNHSAVLNSSVEFLDLRNTNFSNIGPRVPRQVSLSFFALCEGEISSSFEVVCVINRQDSVLSYQQHCVELTQRNPAEWTPYTYCFLLPLDCRPDDLLKIYLWNNRKNDFYIDDYHITYE